MDEGWARFVLDSFEFPYTIVHDAEIRAGHLGERFDTILIASIAPKILREGNPADASEAAYVGGLGREGAEALRIFVQGGGTLVCLESSTAYAIEEFGLPVKNVLKDLKTSEFYSPGSIFHVGLEGRESDLKLGVPYEFSAWFDNSPAFELTGQNQTKSGNVLASYARINTLDSGWLLGPEKVQGKGALVECFQDEGRIVLFGFSPHHRGQPHGTFRLLFNALYPQDR